VNLQLKPRLAGAAAGANARRPLVTRQPLESSFQIQTYVARGASAPAPEPAAQEGTR